MASPPRTFNLRHFADTTGLTDASGNGVRDTLRVAIADLGTGLNNSFTNNSVTQDALRSEMR